MGMFSDWLDNLAMRQFGNDAGGRLAFFPYGWRRPGYYVEAGDQSKIAALAKIYFIANALTSAVGSSATLAFTQALLFDEHGPLRRRLEFGFSVYAIAGLFLYIFAGTASVESLPGAAGRHLFFAHHGRARGDSKDASMPEPSPSPGSPGMDRRLRPHAWTFGSVCRQLSPLGNSVGSAARASHELQLVTSRGNSD